MNEETSEGGEGQEGFRGLLRYTLPGYAGGLLLGGVLDLLGFQTSAVGQWAVRTLSGEGESILEGVFSLRQRLRRAGGSLAEAYGWGKLVGMVVPWIVDWGSRLAGINVYGIEGFYIPYFYAMSDQIGASISGLLFFRRRAGSWRPALRQYVRHPAMLASVGVVLLVPVGLFAARLLGFSPTTQVYTALETIAANLCWVPPVVGWIAERRERRSKENGRSGGPEASDHES